MNYFIFHIIILPLRKLHKIAIIERVNRHMNNLGNFTFGVKNPIQCMRGLFRVWLPLIALHDFYFLEYLI